MPRPRKYDETEVLAAAMEVFWADGYGASTRQLSKAMDINSYSVYAAFESKSRLFERALNHYIDNVVIGSALRPLRSKRAAMPELREFLESFVDTRNRNAPNGCLICNTMIELTEHTPSVSASIQRYRDLMLKAFSRVLVHAFPQMPRKVVRARSEFLFTAILGLFVEKRMGVEGRSIQRLVNEIMATVERDFE